MARHILRIDASARRCGSVCRDLNDRIVDRIAPDGTVVYRDFASGPPLIDEARLDLLARAGPTSAMPR
jgi:FMN-dependent NADH-azoreductase